MDIVEKIESEIGLRSTTEYFRGESQHFKNVCSSLYRQSPFKVIAVHVEPSDAISFNFLNVRFMDEAKLIVKLLPVNDIQRFSQWVAFQYFCKPRGSDRVVDIVSNIDSDKLCDVSLNFAKNESQDKAINLHVMQHLGAPTPFIDFSKDLKVSMFFACRNNFKEDGRIIRLKNTNSRIIDLSSHNFEIGKRRMLAQKAVLLDKIVLDNDEIDVYHIDYFLKREILDKLSSKYGINAKTLFPDKYEIEEVYGKWKMFYEAVNFEIEGRLDEAILNYNAIIEMDRLFVDAYKRRGQLYVTLWDDNKARIDFEKAIELDPCDKIIRCMPFIDEVSNKKCYRFLKKIGRRNSIK